MSGFGGVTDMSGYHIQIHVLKDQNTFHIYFCLCGYLYMCVPTKLLVIVFLSLWIR